jgi:hypothetical protein
MQTRKLSVKTLYDLALAEGLRVCCVVHTVTEPARLERGLVRRGDGASANSKRVTAEPVGLFLS